MTFAFDGEWARGEGGYQCVLLFITVGVGADSPGVIGDRNDGQVYLRAMACLEIGTPSTSPISCASCAHDSPSLRP